MKKCRKNPRGITLIALVITIIILLILAGISIQALTNQGLFKQANRAIDEQTKASMKEQIAMYVSEATYDYHLNNPEGKTYLEFIAEYLENKEDVLIDIVEQNEDEVILNYTQGKNIVQLLLSSDGTLEIIGSGTTSSGIEDMLVVVTYKESSTSQTVLEKIKTKHKAIITLISKPSSLSKEGYEFIGWAESENAEEALDTTYIVPNHNVTLYPVWKKSEVSISLVGAVGETISVYDEDKLITTSTELNASGNSTQNIKVPAKSLKFVGSISGYEKTIEVTSDTTEVKVMPEGALYWYGNQCNGANISENYTYTVKGMTTFQTNFIRVDDNTNSPNYFSGSHVYFSMIDASKYNSIHAIIQLKTQPSSTQSRIYLALDTNPTEYINSNNYADKTSSSKIYISEAFWPSGNDSIDEYTASISNINSTAYPLIAFGLQGITEYIKCYAVWLD